MGSIAHANYIYTKNARVVHVLKKLIDIAFEFILFSCGLPIGFRLDARSRKILKASAERNLTILPDGYKISKAADFYCFEGNSGQF
jgi:hypothetical protein